MNSDSIFAIRRCTESDISLIVRIRKCPYRVQQETSDGRCFVDSSDECRIETTSNTALFHKLKSDNATFSIVRVDRRVSRNRFKPILVNFGKVTIVPLRVSGELREEVVSEVGASIIILRLSNATPVYLTAYLR